MNVYFILHLEAQLFLSDGVMKIPFQSKDVDCIGLPKGLSRRPISAVLFTIAVPQLVEVLI